MEDGYCHDHDSTISYIASNIPGKGCDTELFHTRLGYDCNCLDRCRSGCCACSGGSSNYDENGLLINHSTPVYECWEGCTCEEKKCFNRVVQKGPSPDLVVKPTGSTKGFGLYSSKSLPQGLFVCEYAGEVIGAGEAEIRNKSDQLARNHNYIYWINETYGKEGASITTIIDPTAIGNIGRYANHSCEPNLIVHLVRVESAIPKICLFTNRPVQAGEELTFDYGVRAAQSESDQGLKACHCGTKACKGSLPFHNLVFNSKT